ncbi:MAG: hypothetical protein J2P22_20595 [Nocardioides sp.]|nr:hypothetical protein [Nocardioides sp.]
MTDDQLVLDQLVEDDVDGPPGGPAGSSAFTIIFRWAAWAPGAARGTS